MEDSWFTLRSPTPETRHVRVVSLNEQWLREASRGNWNDRFLFSFLWLLLKCSLDKNVIKKKILKKTLSQNNFNVCTPHSNGGYYFMTFLFQSLTYMCIMKKMFLTVVCSQKSQKHCLMLYTHGTVITKVNKSVRIPRNLEC